MGQLPVKLRWWKSWKRAPDEGRRDAQVGESIRFGLSKFLSNFLEEEWHGEVCQYVHINMTVCVCVHVCQWRRHFLLSLSWTWCYGLGPSLVFQAFTPSSFWLLAVCKKWRGKAWSILLCEWCFLYLGRQRGARGLQYVWTCTLQEILKLIQTLQSLPLSIRVWIDKTTWGLDLDTLC